MKRFDLIWKTETCHANRNYKNCFASLIRLQRHTQYGNGNNIMAGVDVMSIGGGGSLMDKPTKKCWVVVLISFDFSIKRLP